MKISKKDGTPRLEKGEIRIGNFFIRDEGDNEHIRVVDLNSCFTIRVWKKMPLGIWLDNMLKRGDSAHGSIKTWIAVMWSVLSVAPDDGFIRALYEASRANLTRHPDWYGVEGNATEEEDEDALKEVEVMTDIEEKIKKEIEENDKED